MGSHRTTVNPPNPLAKGGARFPFAKGGLDSRLLRGARFPFAKEVLKGLEKPNLYSYGLLH